MRVLPAGDRALLVEVESLAGVLDLFQRLAPHRPDGVVEIVPAARTLLVRFDPDEISVSSVSGWLQSHATAAGSDLSRPESLAEAAACVEVPVRYDGEDLDEVAQMLGLTHPELIERHTGQDFLAAFAGFAPGFVYLSGGDPCFHGISRRAVPRTRVPAGSVAVAGGFSAVYPSDSPGGWRLLGTTPLRMWDLQRQTPALVQPGFRVRFRDLAAPGTHYSLPGSSTAGTGARARMEGGGEALARKHEGAAASGIPATAVDSPSASAWWEVQEPGLQTLVQDLGRPGMTALGVSASGALDRAAMARANRLVGNPAGAAVLENAWGGLSLVCHGRAVVAVSGAPVAVALTTASGMRLPAAAESRLAVEDGQTLRLGRPRAGVRCYLAVRGGWDVAPVLGSRSTDVLAGIGPAPLRKHDRLRVAPPSDDAAVPEDSVGSAERVRRAPGSCEGGPSHSRPGDTVWLDVIPGPRDDWFDASALALLAEQAWVVTPQSNRVGLRLAGDRPLGRLRAGELASEGMVAGALEVPPSGQPVLFLADHPLTGGYPVIAVVAARDLDVLAQVPPGARLRFKVREALPG